MIPLDAQISHNFFAKCSDLLTHVKSRQPFPTKEKILREFLGDIRP